MSLILCTFSENRQTCRIAVDTAGMRPKDGFLFEMSKLFTWPHVPAALAGRGVLTFNAMMFAELSLAIGQIPLEQILALHHLRWAV